MFLRLEVLINLIIILSHPVSTQGRETSLADILKRRGIRNYSNLRSNVYRLISFKLGTMTDTIELCSLMPALVALTFIQGCCYMRNENVQGSLPNRFLNQFRSKFCVLV